MAAATDRERQSFKARNPMADIREGDRVWVPWRDQDGNPMPGPGTVIRVRKTGRWLTYIVADGTGGREEGFSAENIECGICRGDESECKPQCTPRAAERVLLSGLV
jgi:hypothetical protein